MMRITAEDTFDGQPLHDGDLTLVADLRLDNREELAMALSVSAETLAGMPDSALLLAAVKTWGADCVDHLIGDFAFAVWDAGKRTLTLARDHMGQRHVFFHQGQGFFAFASEIKGLWALPQVPRILIEESVAQLLLFDESNEIGTTIYEGIQFIPGGTVMTVSADGSVTSRRYWEPHADPAHEGHDDTYYIETYRKVLAEAVACRLRRATRPGGLFMGGGFDSSAICALAGQVVATQGSKLIAVSSVMPENYSGTVRHARRWVDMCRRHMPHLDVRYVTREGLDIFSGMEAAFLSNDNLHSPRGYVTRAMMAEVASAGARVLMDGHGGDYTVNPRSPAALVSLLRTFQLSRFFSEFNAARRHLGLSVGKTVIRGIVLQIVPRSWLHLWTRYRNGLNLFGPTLPLSRRVIATRSKHARSRIRGRSRGSQRVAMERALRYQQNVPAQAFSVAAAAQGLEFTQPFHDKRVVEFGLAIREDLYFKNGKMRYLAREALKELYPPGFQGRPPGNDDFVPDVLAMAKRVEPRVLTEIDRMEKAGYLSRYFDFPRMRVMLTRRTIERHSSGNEYDTRQAMLAFLAARYIEWFRGNNC